METPDLTVAGESFGIDLDRRPKLVLKTFSGTHDIRAAVSPDCSYELLMDTLNHAQSELLIYIYNVSAPHILDLIAQAKQRQVKIKIMYDAKDTSGGEVQKLKNLQVELKVAPSRDPRRVFDVCHQKFVVVDRKRILLGSANWAGTSIPERLPGKPRKKGNREWLIRIDQSTIAEWFATLFDGDYAIKEFPSFAIAVEAAREPLTVPAPSMNPPLDVSLKRFANLKGDLTPVVSPDNYFTHVKGMLDRATKRILVQQQYIVGGPSAPSIEKFMGVLSAKKTQGVDVRLIVSSRFASGWSNSKKTAQFHGLIKQFKAINLDTFVHCHNKGVIVDDEVVISSTNWSENSVRRAREAGVAIRNQDLANFYAVVFEDDWENGWTVAQGDAGPSFDVPVVGAEMVQIHPADAE